MYDRKQLFVDAALKLLEISPLGDPHDFFEAWESFRAAGLSYLAGDADDIDALEILRGMKDADG